METKRIRWILWACLLLTFESLAASVVILKNGDIYTGTLKTEKPKSYVFNSRFGELAVNKTDVENIIWSEKKIKLQEFKVDQKTLKGRVVRDTATETAFLTEAGAIVRVKKEAKKAPQQKPIVNALPFYVSLAPTAGITKVRTIKFNDGFIDSDTVSGPNTFGVQAGLGYEIMGPLLSAQLELGFTLVQHHSTSSGPPPESAPADAPDNTFDGNYTQTKQTAALGLQFFFTRFFVGRDSLLGGFYLSGSGGMVLSQVEMKVKDFGGLDDLEINWKGNKAFPFMQGQLGWMFPVTRRLAIDVAGGVQYEFIDTPYKSLQLPEDLDAAQESAGQDLVESLEFKGDNPINLYMRIGAAFRF